MWVIAFLRGVGARRQQQDHDPSLALRSRSLGVGVAALAGVEQAVAVAALVVDGGAGVVSAAGALGLLEGGEALGEGVAVKCAVSSGRPACGGDCSGIVLVDARARRVLGGLADVEDAAVVARQVVHAAATGLAAAGVLGLLERGRHVVTELAAGTVPVRRLRPAPLSVGFGKKRLGVVS